VLERLIGTEDLAVAILQLDVVRLEELAELAFTTRRGRQLVR